MIITRFAAENVLRLRAVEIAPDGTVQIVTGQNAQGKSSVLNAIFLAIAGGAASRAIAKPVRDGEESATVSLDIGDAEGTKLIVTRTWDEKGTRLTVKAADGTKYQRPQELLDGLIGALSFDPLAFVRKPAKDQREDLLALLGLDFTAEDAEKAKLYDQRTEVGQRANAYGDLPKLPKDAPTRETPATEIVDRIRESDKLRSNIAARRADVERYQRRAADIEAEIESLTAEREACLKDAKTIAVVLDGLPIPEDPDALRTALAEVEDRNRVARENARISANRAAQADLEKERLALTHKIKAIDESKAKAIAAAKMPIEGLGFDDSGVTYNGVPFSQASTAEQIRVSVTMAMAENPTLRIILSHDGSLLDKNSLAILKEMVKDADYQLWLEVVGDADSAGESAVVIEDGSVAEREATS